MSKVRAYDSSNEMNQSLNETYFNFHMTAVLLVVVVQFPECTLKNVVVFSRRTLEQFVIRVNSRLSSVMENDVSKYISFFVLRNIRQLSSPCRPTLKHGSHGSTFLTFWATAHPISTGHNCRRTESLL